jgi:hypothetical protein
MLFALPDGITKVLKGGVRLEEDNRFCKLGADPMMYLGVNRQKCDRS